MSFRDDRDALLYRVDSLESELERTKREAEELRKQNEQLKAEAAADDEGVEEEEEPEPEPAANADPEQGSGLGVAIGGGVTVAAVAASTVALGPLVTGALTAVAGAFGAIVWLGRRARRSTLAYSFPVPFRADLAAVRDALTSGPRSLIVRIECHFAVRPQRGRRDAITKQLSSRGLRPKWDKDVVTISSHRIKQAREEDLRRFLSRASVSLTRVHERTPIEHAIARAGS